MKIYSSAPALGAVDTPSWVVVGLGAAVATTAADLELSHNGIFVLGGNGLEDRVATSVVLSSQRYCTTFAMTRSTYLELYPNEDADIVAQGSIMAVVKGAGAEAVNVADFGGTGTSFSQVVGAGTNRGVVIGVHAAVQPSAVVCGAKAATLEMSTTFGLGFLGLYSVIPSGGGSQTVTVSFSASVQYTGSIMWFTDVDQTDMLTGVQLDAERMFQELITVTEIPERAEGSLLITGPLSIGEDREGRMSLGFGAGHEGAEVSVFEGFAIDHVWTDLYSPDADLAGHPEAYTATPTAGFPWGSAQAPLLVSGEGIMNSWIWFRSVDSYYNVSRPERPFSPETTPSAEPLDGPGPLWLFWKPFILRYEGLYYVEVGGDVDNVHGDAFLFVELQQQGNVGMYPSFLNDPLNIDLQISRNGQGRLGTNGVFRASPMQVMYISASFDSFTPHVAFTNIFFRIVGPLQSTGIANSFYWTAANNVTHLPSYP